MEELIMEIFLLIVVLILIDIVEHQEKISELDRETLDVFRIVCQKINVQS